MFPSQAEKERLISNAQFMAQLERRQQHAAATQPQRDALVTEMQALQSEYDQRVGGLQAQIDEWTREYSRKWQGLKDRLTQAGG